mmetsp:Transcript_42847/g.110490  ORF Transcript_42847/g.110490 Transcript_42847/m.110490 type:complete len:119 (-) Transcript_42847:666-1022(-)
MQNMDERKWRKGGKRRGWGEKGGRERGRGACSSMKGKELSVSALSTLCHRNRHNLVRLFFKPACPLFDSDRSTPTSTYTHLTSPHLLTTSHFYSAPLHPALLTTAPLTTQQCMHTHSG